MQHADLLKTLLEKELAEHEHRVSHLTSRAPEIVAIQEAVESMTARGARVFIDNATQLHGGWQKGKSTDILVFAVTDTDFDEVTSAARDCGFDVWTAQMQSGLMCVHPTGWMLHIRHESSPAMAIAA